ncbi:MAG: NADH-quinone oxidoreductase subunit NuoN [Alphaproteobacteria bacterium]|nr:NADH-quinone oxidoreductase subunit NuoN [Alphaproteobacteria bacterium]
MMYELPNLVPALPEILLAVAALGLLMVGVFRKKDATGFVGGLAVAALVVAGIVEVNLARVPVVTTLGGMFVLDGFAVFVKALVLLAAVLTAIMSLSWLRQEKLGQFEFPVLLIFATLGMMMMVSANDLMALYLGLELQSLSLYVLAAYHRDNLRSTEAGLKYFMLGALASGLLLFGASFIYGFTGATGFDAIAKALGDGASVPVGVTVGIVFLLAGLAFKISAVPFHMWTPDVYEGAPTPVTALFAVGPKIAALALLIRVMVGPFGHLVEQWHQVVVALSLASMVLGAFAAIHQTNIKRLMAYSSIGHVGYALIGVAVGNAAGVRGVLVYLAIYLFMNIGTFTVILSMRQRGRMVEQIEDLAGLSKSNPLMALALAIFMFSMAGIPPLAGFFGKLYVFIAAIQAHMYTLAVLGVLTSVVGAYYYLRIVKVMYFDEPADSFDRPIGRSMTFILTGTSLVILLFFLFPEMLLTGAETAAASLFHG